MKKLIALTVLAGLVAYNSYGASVSIRVAGGTYTNLLTGSVRITQIVLSAPTATNTSVSLVDSPTNSLTSYNPPFTNIYSYQTNFIGTYTDYFGVTVLYTNLQQFDVSNSVAAGTNTWPIRVGASALASTTTTINNGNYVFLNGVWITNTVATGDAIVTLTYQK